MESDFQELAVSTGRNLPADLPGVEEFNYKLIVKLGAFVSITMPQICCIEKHSHLLKNKTVCLFWE